MMTALIDEPGKFRSGGVEVFDGKKAVHIAPPAEFVPGQIKNLFKWLKSAPDHLLIKSCVFTPLPTGTADWGGCGNR